AKRLSRIERLVLLCGRYEGVDDRVRACVAEEVSIGDYVLTGGELAALVILDAVARFVPGVVGDEQSVAEDSFNRGLLDYPQYTRPAEVSVQRAAGGVLKVQRCCCRATTARFGGGASARRCRGRSIGARTCWPLRAWTT